jgi:hypothetical protein
MGRKKTVEGTADSNTHTFYCSPEMWKQYQAVAESMDVPASALLRTDIQNTITKFNGGDLRPKFNLAEKERALLAFKNTIQKHFDVLKKDVLPNRKTAYETMVAVAKQFGTDDQLVKNIDEALDELRNYECSGKEPFNDSHLVAFVLYVEALLSRRAVEAEIKSHWRQRIKSPKAGLPKLEESLVA